jgi:hypothetical protein
LVFAWSILQLIHKRVEGLAYWFPNIPSVREEMHFYAIGTGVYR